MPPRSSRPRTSTTRSRSRPAEEPESTQSEDYPAEEALVDRLEEQEEIRPVRPTRSRSTTRTSTRTTKSRATKSTEAAASAPAPAPAPEPVAPPEPAEAPTGFDFDESTEVASPGAAPGAAPGPGGPAGYDDGRPRRRRRRRGRRGQDGGGPTNTGGQAQSGHRQQFPRRQGQGGQQGGGRPQRHGQPHQQSMGGYQNDRPETGPSGGVVEGVLELHPKGYGFLRNNKNNYVADKLDPFVAGSLIERCKLREGIHIKGEVVVGTKGQGPRLRTIMEIDGRTLEEYQQIKPFEELTAINPYEQIRLETGPFPITMRVLDLLTPIGKGQRALLVAPPRSGKTMLLQEIANAVSTNHPEIHLMVLLIDERPEEVTEMRRRVRGEVISSSMDRDVESHVRISQLIIERAKRIAEAGGDVFVLLDSITRTARAFNKWIGNSGRTMTGGIDVKAMDIPKKMFGTARRFDEGGSLTVAGTALVDTGSSMDQIIFQEFKGTGNMELVLDRRLADRRIWPALDIKQSGTRREEKILSPEVLEGVTLLRRSLISLDPVDAMEQLTKTLAKFPSNADFLSRVKQIL